MIFLVAVMSCCLKELGALQASFGLLLGTSPPSRGIQRGKIPPKPVSFAQIEQQKHRQFCLRFSLNFCSKHDCVAAVILHILRADTAALTQLGIFRGLTLVTL
jgi:hypothetical protein